MQTRFRTRAARDALLWDEVTVDRALLLVGLLVGAIGSAVLIRLWLLRLDLVAGWSITVYAACLLAMLCCSAVYNLSTNPSWRPILRRFDHAAIFLMIAGTYTPFTVRMLPASLGSSITGLVWAIALLGAVLKLLSPHRLDRLDLGLYLGLGWMILAVWEPLRASIDGVTACLLLSGGVFYTIGAGFYAARRLRFHNAIWHAFVLVAVSCHYVAVLHGIR